jgi:hypothetical protein
VVSLPVRSGRQRACKRRDCGLVWFFDDLNSTHEIDPLKQTWTANQIYAQAAARVNLSDAQRITAKRKPRGRRTFPRARFTGQFVTEAFYCISSGSAVTRKQHSGLSES